VLRFPSILLDQAPSLSLVMAREWPLVAVTLSSIKRAGFGGRLPWSALGGADASLKRGPNGQQV
jgi:hypothetical protein